MPWKEIAGKVIFGPETVMVLRLDVPSDINREFIGYQRSQGRVKERKSPDTPKSLLLTEKGVFLLSSSIETVKKAIEQT